VKEKGKYVVWPNYLDSTKTRREGRRVPQKIAVESPKLQEIEEAAKILGLTPTINPNAAYPRARWEKKGYALIDKKNSKLSNLKKIAEKIHDLRKSKIQM
jgi:signal recognition particle subunit SRP19